MPPRRKPSSDIVKFFAEEKNDFKDRALSVIIALKDKDLEKNHDYIQILFPLPEPTSHNLLAPLLDETTVKSFRESKELRDNLLRCFTRMLLFYGLHLRVDEKEVVLSKDFATIYCPWIKPSDHNHQRITRILRCLRILGLEDYAIAFHKALVTIYETSSIGKLTKEFWDRAVTMPLHIDPRARGEDVDSPGAEFLKKL